MCILLIHWRHGQNMCQIPICSGWISNIDWCQFPFGCKNLPKNEFSIQVEALLCVYSFLLGLFVWSANARETRRRRTYRVLGIGVHDGIPCVLHFLYMCVWVWANMSCTSEMDMIGNKEMSRSHDVCNSISDTRIVANLVSPYPVITQWPYLNVSLTCRNQWLVQFHERKINYNLFQELAWTLILDSRFILHTHRIAEFRIQ